jgi:hypothetical protein
MKKDNIKLISAASTIAAFCIIPCSIANAQVVELHDLRCSPINYRLALLDACSPSIHLALKNVITIAIGGGAIGGAIGMALCIRL